MIPGGGQNNLSCLNRDINEWSVIYWAWKNYEALGNPDYIGLMHYRRLFDFRGKAKTGWCTYADALGLNEKCLNEILDRYDFVYRKGFEMKDKFNGFCCYQPEVGLSESYHPLLYKGYLRFERDRILYPNNMFIMKRSDFFDFCNECMPLMLDILKTPKNILMLPYLRAIKKNLNPERFEGFYNSYKRNGNYAGRHVSYIMERITSFYISHLIEKYNASSLSCPIIRVEPPIFVAIHGHTAIKAIVKVLVRKDEYKEFKQDPVKFSKNSNSQFIKLLSQKYPKIK